MVYDILRTNRDADDMHPSIIPPRETKVIDI